MNKPITISLAFGDILPFILIMVGTWAFQFFLLKKIFNKISEKFEQRGLLFESHALKMFNRSIRYTLLVTIFFYSLHFFTNIQFWEIPLLMKLYKSLLIILFVSGIYRLLGFYAEHPEEWKLFNKEKMTHLLFPFLCRFGKYTALFMAFVMIANEWGYAMNGFLTGLGIGGIALALGTKDVLSHIFGGMAVALDKPFSIGDLISTEDKQIQGFVEDMNFRSTRIRTFDKAVIYVPNALLANKAIFNYTRRDKRRVRFHIGIDLNTPEDKIRTLIDRIHGEIFSHPGVSEDNVNVFVDEYTQTALNILILYYTNTADFADAMYTKQEINLAIRKILDEEGIPLSPAVHYVTSPK